MILLVYVYLGQSHHVNFYVLSLVPTEGVPVPRIQIESGHILFSIGLGADF